MPHGRSLAARQSIVKRRRRTSTGMTNSNSAAIMAMPASDRPLSGRSGRVIQHIASEPPNLNFATENSAVIHWIHYSIHAALLEFNPSTWVYDPVLCTTYDVEDTIVLKGSPIKNGMRYRLSVDEGVLKAIGQAVKFGNGAPLPEPEEL